MRQWTKGALLGAAILGPAVLIAPTLQARGEPDEVQKHVDIVRHLGGGAFLGVRLEDAAASERGAVVKKVDADTPAANAGIKEGDVIVRFDGEAVRSASQLTRLVRETPVGRSVPIEITRGGAKQTLRATLAERKAMSLLGDFDLPAIAGLVPPVPPDAPEAPRAPRPPRMRFRWDGDGPHGLLWGPGSEGGPRKLGIRYQEIEGQLAKYFKVSGDEAVLVTDVEPDGPAAKAGMKAGDVLLKLDGKAVEDSGDLRELLASADAGSEVTVQVQREGRPVDLKVKLAGERERKEGI